MTLPLPLVLAAYAMTSYLVCGIPFGKVVAESKGVDIQHVGSGNIGTTNVARSVGAGAAGLTLLFDAGKGLLCTGLARPVIGFLALGGDASALEPSGELSWALALVFLACILGHAFSPYLGFKGGKGIAVGLGATLGCSWTVAIGLAIVFFSIAFATKYVSLSSCCAAVSLPFLCAFLTQATPVYLAIMSAAAALVVWSHRSNIGRLMRGEEPKFAFHHDDAGAKPGKD